MAPNAAELRALAEVFGQARDHHDPEQPEISHDLSALANRAAGLTQTNAGFLELLLSNPATVALIQAAIAAALAKLTAPKPPVVVAPPAPVTPALPAGVGVVTQPALVTAVRLSLAGVNGPRRNGAQPVPYTLLPGGRIVPNDTSTLDDGSLLVLDAEIGTDQADVRIEEHPELLGCVRFVAEDAASGEVLGEIGGDYAPKLSEDGLRTTSHRVESGVGFSEDRYRKSQCMSCVANLKRKGGPIKVYAVALSPAGIATAISESYTSPEVR